MRIAQEWVYRTQNQVLAARSRFSVGVDALGATINPAGEPDGQFFAWLGQFQWVRLLGILDTQLIFRSAVQLAAESLLAPEQIAVGGRYSVRGYRENTLVRDNAFLASLEGRLPLVRNVRWADFLELAPFVDYGRAWNTDLPTLDPKDIWSVGVGLRWGLTISEPAPTYFVPLRAYFEIYWGHPLRDVPTVGGDLQDDGIHLQFIFGAY